MPQRPRLLFPQLTAPLLRRPPSLPFPPPPLQLDAPASCTYPLFEVNVPLPVGAQTVVCGQGYTYFRSSAPLPAGCIPT